jgi:hypothetical protein
MEAQGLESGEQKILEVPKEGNIELRVFAVILAHEGVP